VRALQNNLGCIAGRAGAGDTLGLCVGVVIVSESVGAGLTGSYLHIQSMIKATAGSPGASPSGAYP
jgi:hypothetical protein